MAIKVKPLADISEKFVRVAATRQQDYEAGVRDPGTDWATATAAAAETYNAGIQEAVQRNAFTKGVNAAGTAKWQKGTAGKGVQRWAPGIRDSRADYETGFAPYREALERVTLPPKGPRGDERNFQRSVAVGRALADVRRKG